MFVGIFDHSTVRSDTDGFTVSALLHPKGVLSG